MRRSRSSVSSSALLWMAVASGIVGIAGAGQEVGQAPPQAGERAQDAGPPGLDVDEKATPAEVAAYLDGLEALESARWADAVTAFAKAIEEDPDQPAYHRARGVAHALAERLPEAIADLRRATKLRPEDQETRIWLAVAMNMDGDSYHAREVYAAHTNDPYETFLGQVRIDYGFLSENRRRGEESPRDQARRESARQKFPQAGAWYARRMKDTPAMARVLFARAKQRFRRREFEPAMADLEFVRSRFPQEMAVLYYHAGCLTALGDAATARQEYTQVLTRFTSFALAYAGRARAVAQLGDAHRARADLAIASSLRPGDASAFRAAVEEELAALKAGAPSGTPEALRASLEASARDGAPPDQLADRAVALRRAVLARRLDEDEVYQGRLKALEDALRASPRNPDRMVDLAEFLTREARARYERHAPRGPFRLLREEVPRDPEGEFARAEGLADRAIAIDPRNPRAMVAKARVAFEFNRFGDADELLRKALAIREDVPDGLELWARVITVGASQAEAAASRLETPQSGSTFTTNATITWTRYPSPEELRQAEEFRAIARRRLDRARQVFEKAIRLRPRDGQGYYDLALWRLGQNDAPGARESLEKAVELAPGLVRARQALAKVYRDLGMEDRALQEESILITQVEGAVGDLLAQASKAMERTAWKSAGTTLARAALADPVDARVPAYLGVVRTAEAKPAEAAAAWRLALALEEARLRPAAGAAKGAGTGPASRNPDDLALLMTLRLKLAGLEVREKRPAEALKLAEANAGLESRIGPPEMLRELPTSLLPDADPDPDRRPEPENAASLIAWSHFEAGRALHMMKRTDEAARHLQAAFSAGRSLTVGQGTRPLNEPRNRAGLALCWILLSRGQAQAAMELQQQVDVTVRHSMSRELAAEKDKLIQAIRQALGPSSGYGNRP